MNRRKQKQAAKTKHGATLARELRKAADSYDPDPKAMDTIRQRTRGGKS